MILFFLDTQESKRKRRPQNVLESVGWVTKNSPKALLGRLKVFHIPTHLESEQSVTEICQSTISLNTQAFLVNDTKLEDSQRKVSKSFEKTAESSLPVSCRSVKKIIWIVRTSQPLLRVTYSPYFIVLIESLGKLLQWCLFTHNCDSASSLSRTCGGQMTRSAVE